MSRYKIAGVQMDIKFADRDQNLSSMKARLDETVSQGAVLTVFPECTTTGYCFDSLDEARPHGETLEGTAVQTVASWCQELQTKVIFGFLELDCDEMFNSLALLGPSGVLGRYRKMHLPHLGIDRFTTPGKAAADVIDTGEMRIGMNICYDSAFPEAARMLAIKGADLIALPTNWPPTSGITADVIPNARALENHVYFMSVNRIGTENGFTFIGKSKICDPRGNSLSFADHANEEILFAEIDPELARQKHLITIPGEHEVHRFKDRRPDLYGSLSDPFNPQ
ncbi:MAG: carbon-nitrogen hydrolase family protein [Planctomycetota bacterium]